MKITVIDGQGGKLGALVVEAVKKDIPDAEVLAIGTNSIATSAMMKAGADRGATGENPVIVAGRNSDVIIGPIGMISADSLLGEITPDMAIAIGQSPAVKLLLPVSHCNNIVVGLKDLSMNGIVKETIGHLKMLFK